MFFMLILFLFLCEICFKMSLLCYIKFIIIIIIITEDVDFVHFGKKHKCRHTSRIYIHSSF